jgi:hypothetical protein
MPDVIGMKCRIPRNAQPGRFLNLREKFFVFLFVFLLISICILAIHFFLISKYNLGVLAAGMKSVAFAMLIPLVSRTAAEKIEIGKDGNMTRFMYDEMRQYDDFRKSGYSIEEFVNNQNEGNGKNSESLACNEAGIKKGAWYDVMFSLIGLATLCLSLMVSSFYLAFRIYYYGDMYAKSYFWNIGGFLGEGIASNSLLIFSLSIFIGGIGVATLFIVMAFRCFSIEPFISPVVPFTIGNTLSLSPPSNSLVTQLRLILTVLFMYVSCIISLGNTPI